MKVSIIIAMVFTLIGCTAQITVLHVQNYPNDGDLDGYYFKDTTGLLNTYQGVWQWEEGNQELTFYLYKDIEVTFNHPFRGTYKMDVIYGYYIYKENGIELINTKPELLANNAREDIQRGGFGMKPTNTGYTIEDAPSAYFVDFSRRVCRDGIEVPVTASPGYWRFENASTARVGLFTAGTIYSNCETQYLFPDFPSNQGVTLARIAAEAPPL